MDPLPLCATKELTSPLLHGQGTAPKAGLMHKHDSYEVNR